MLASIIWDPEMPLVPELLMYGLSVRVVIGENALSCPILPGSAKEPQKNSSPRPKPLTRLLVLFLSGSYAGCLGLASEMTTRPIFTGKSLSSSNSDG